MIGPMPYTTDDRTVIPCYCWIKQPGTETRCTERPNHSGDHYSMRRHVTWPNTGPAPQ